MDADTTPQEMFEALAASADPVSVQNEVDAIVRLLGPAQQSSWFRFFLKV
jgi:hypothetical protein